MRYRGFGCLAACAVAALAGLGSGTAAGQAGVQACVGTGLLATQAPGASAPAPVGPMLLGPDRDGASLPSAAEPSTGLSAGPVSLGVAGCTDSAGTPGGTTLRAGAWSIFDGAVRGGGLRADLVPRPADGSGWHLRATVQQLVVGGQPLELGPGDQAKVGDWATLTAQPDLSGLTAAAGLRFWRAALELTLTRAHAGLAARTTVLIGWVAADREPLAQPATETPTAPTTTTTTKPASSPAPSPVGKAPAVAKPRRRAAKTHRVHKAAKHPTSAHVKRVRHAKHAHHAKKARRARRLTGRPLQAVPFLGPGSRTFPVVGDVAWGDTYGAPRSDVSGGWHHGDDLFAPLGTPVVAVADGTLFSVGWNEVGGWRLWLVDARGNQYYYAHLSGYTALARDNRRVKRGQVLGFVGNTGDAATTWPHVHFEVHPSGFLYLGYNGAVDPTRYLSSWARVEHVPDAAPVALPPGAPSGAAVQKDFRALLAIRPMKTHPSRTAPAAAAAPTQTVRRRRPASRGVLSAAAAPATPSHGGNDGAGAIVAGVLLLAAALVAVIRTAQAGRREA